jgi:hypothetical protein
MKNTTETALGRAGGLALVSARRRLVWVLIKIYHIEELLLTRDWDDVTK